MALGLRALAALEEDPGLVCRINMVVHSDLNSSTQDPVPTFGLYQDSMRTVYLLMRSMHRLETF